jgi:hypothetical protein
MLDSVTEAISQHNSLHGTGITDKFGRVFRSLFERLGKFETAIDMLAQSMPQVMGLSLVGIIWGSIKILLVVSQSMSHDWALWLTDMQYSRDFVDTISAVVDELDHILMGVPALEVYVQIFGASRIRLLEEPLVALYAALINFGIEAAKLFDGKYAMVSWHDRQIDYLGRQEAYSISRHETSD